MVTAGGLLRRGRRCSSARRRVVNVCPVGRGGAAVLFRWMRTGGASSGRQVVCLVCCDVRRPGDDQSRWHRRRALSCLQKDTACVSVGDTLYSELGEEGPGSEGEQVLEERKVRHFRNLPWRRDNGRNVSLVSGSGAAEGGRHSCCCSFPRRGGQQQEAHTDAPGQHVARTKVDVVYVGELGE